MHGFVSECCVSSCGREIRSQASFFFKNYSYRSPTISFVSFCDLIGLVYLQCSATNFRRTIIIIVLCQLRHESGAMLLMLCGAFYASVSNLIISMPCVVRISHWV